MSGVAVARAAGAETLRTRSASLQLLLDASATGGALSAHRVHLSDGADGAAPNRHADSSEMFFVLAGTVDLLVGERTVTATAGDLVVIPAGASHAFAASAGSDGELLVVLTPGVERFEFFRQFVRVANGEASGDALAGAGPRYDTHGVTSEPWRRARAGTD